jgi:hypothetical protein
LAFAADLSQNLITKWVDGVKAEDWVSSANGLDAARRSLQPTALLFGDGDGDDRAPCAVKSIQISSVKLSDAAMMALGGPSGSGIPIVIPSISVTPPSLKITVSAGQLTISWPVSATGLTLKSTPSLSSPNWQAVSGVVNNSVTIAIGAGNQFFALHQ